MASMKNSCEKIIMSKSDLTCNAAYLYIRNCLNILKVFLNVFIVQNFLEVTKKKVGVDFRSGIMLFYFIKCVLLAFIVH